MLNSFLYCSPPNVLKYGLSLDLELTISDRPSDQ